MVTRNFFKNSIYIHLFVAEKYDRKINKRLSSIKYIILELNSVGEVDWKYNFLLLNKSSFVYFLKGWWQLSNCYDICILLDTFKTAM